MMAATQTDPITKRKLILFQPPGFDNSIFNELVANDWDVFLAFNFQQASDLLYKYTFNVGLCLVEKQCNSSSKLCILDTCRESQYLTQLNQLFNLHSQCNWVLGVSSVCVPLSNPNSIESKLIADFCYNYVTFPVDMGRLLFTLGHAHGMNEISQAYQKSHANYPSSFGIIGSSPALVDLFKDLQKIAKEDCSVLIEGETGTGKELVSGAIHKYSGRSEHPFVAVNCGAYPKDLIQAELFGYEKGAFTGAQQRRIGLIESAQGGTLFLDEIGDLPLAQQVNLLRFLEERTIERIGGSTKIPIDVRIIAATHVDLKAAVQKKTFREDLYYRLRVLQMKTPPLRARENDIEMLASYFFSKFSAGKKYKAKGFHSDSLYMMKIYDWPGNVRELMNCVRHAVVMSENRLLTPADLVLEGRCKGLMLQTLEEARSLAERELIATCLHHTKNNMSRAAELLGISRVALYQLVKKHKVAVYVGAE
jgi:DNA-binding NtrC family response regulator